MTATLAAAKAFNHEHAEMMLNEFNRVIHNAFFGHDKTLETLRSALWNAGYEAYHMPNCHWGSDSAVRRLQTHLNKKYDHALAATIGWLGLKGCAMIMQPASRTLIAQPGSRTLFTATAPKDILSNLHLPTPHEDRRETTAGYWQIMPIALHHVVAAPSILQTELDLIKRFVRDNVPKLDQRYIFNNLDKYPASLKLLEKIRLKP